MSAEVINRVFPILLLISLGYLIRRRSLLGEKTIADLRWLVVNLALPSVLFISFLNIALKLEYLFIFILIFLLCFLLYFLGLGIRSKFNVGTEYYPFLTTGFEYGMLGVSLFGAAYGVSRIGYIAVVDLGHEIFIWFVMLPMLLMKRDGAGNVRQVAKSFFSSPVVIAIFTGIFLNVFGISSSLPNLPVIGGIMSGLSFLGDLTVPLILLLIGYGIDFKPSTIIDVLGLIVLRLAFLIPLAMILNNLLVRDWLNMEPLFEAAFFTLLVLPPPFIIPLYLRQGLADYERGYINNALAVYTVVSIVIFIFYFSSNPL